MAESNAVCFVAYYDGYWDLDLTNWLGDFRMVHYLPVRGRMCHLWRGHALVRHQGTKAGSRTVAGMRFTLP